MTSTIIALFVAFFAAPASQPAWQSLPHGQLILRPFEHAPYPHASRESGFKTFPRDPHYVDSTVAIFIPDGYVAGDAVNYVVHFHGHKNEAAKAMKENKLAEQLAAAKLDAILIAPQGPKNAADSGGGKLELDAGAFAKLIEEVTAFLNSEGKIKTTQIGKIVLTTHSGGYKVTAGILHLGGLEKNITDVILLDSSYGSLEWFADWCKADPTHRLVSLYTEHLADENAELIKMLDQRNLRYVKAADITDDQLRSARGPFFIPVTVGHGAVPTVFFGRMLSTSALAAP